MTTTHIVTVLNRAWDALQRNTPDIPNVMIVTGRRRHKSENATRGSHCADTWHVDGCDGRQAEVWISGERLSEGGVAVMQTLIHEAAHALARARDIKDTSNRGRYHSKAFVKLAEELGLEGPAESGGPTMGYSDCTITRKTEEIYSYEIGKLEEACRNFVAPAIADAAAPRAPKVKAFCQCPEDENEITWTKVFEKKLQATGIPPLLCGICRQAFIPEDSDIPLPTGRSDMQILKMLRGAEA